MARTFVLRRWLTAGPLSGRRALLLALCAVAIPTAALMATDSFATGALVAPYVPFILVSAVLLPWWNATLVALVAALLDDLLFVGAPLRFLEGPADLFVVGTFIFVAGTIIGFVELVRRMIRDKPAEAEQSSGIIFSLKDGQAWASRPGLGAPVRLGPEEEVVKMMEDYLAQRELAERLKAAAKTKK